MSMRQFELLCDDFAALLSHPQQDHQLLLDKVLGSISNRKCLKALRMYQKEIAGLTPEDLQDLYTRTFDLTPLCSPALSVHLFGVESFKRSHLMVGLLDMYRQGNYPAAGETADHMSTVLGFLSYTSPEERSEIARFILLPALKKMTEFLESKSNLYAYLLSATSALVVAETGKEATYA